MTKSIPPTTAPTCGPDHADRVVPTLTLGIPTFNRCPIVSHRVAELIAAHAPEQVDIVVIDDASPDGTYAALTNLCADTSVRILRNVSNLGYAGNLLRLFDECRTPYLLIGSDDDVVLTECLAPLTRLLEERFPAFVSTQFDLNETLYRGHRAVDPISPKDLFAACAHAPGLVYHVPTCRDVALDAVRARLNDGCMAAWVYPQMLILSRLLLAEKNCLWWDQYAIIGGALAPTGIKDGDGSPYYHLTPRWRQVQDLLDFLGEERLRPAGTNLSVATALEATVTEYLFWMLRSAIEHERPDLVAPFDDQAARFYAERRRWNVFRQRTRRIVRHPSATVGAIARRLRLRRQARA